MSQEQRNLRLNRTLLACAGVAYLNWWLFVRLTLPEAFNPFPSRLAVVACFFAVFAASFAVSTIARHLDGWLALCCCIATVHYFYLFEHNHTDLTWMIGSYITVMAVCAVLQTARSLLAYSLFTAALSVAFVMRVPEISNVVFMPGMLTILLFANIGLRGRLRLLGRLQESNQRIESLFDAGFEGIVVHEGGTIREVNGAMARLLGYSRAELLGKNIAQILAAQSRLPAAPVVGAVEAAQEDQALKKDGTRVTVEVSGRPHLLDGREMRLVALRDLTERRRAENALLLANRELESFSYSVAHDLRAPLRGINGFSRILLEDNAAQLDAEGKRHLERIGAGAETMGRLIDALLALARVSRAEPRHEPVNLTLEAGTVASQLHAAQPDRLVDFVNQEGVMAHGDPLLLRALLDNLIGNAWKFTGQQPSPRVTFGCNVREGLPVYFVQDNGAGFEMDRANKLFIPFQRLHDAGVYPGTGIGLATVQRIVHRHGGRVWAEGAVGRGATFYFTLQAGGDPA